MKEQKNLTYGKQHHQVLFIFTNIHSNVRAQTLSKFLLLFFSLKNFCQTECEHDKLFERFNFKLYLFEIVYLHCLPIEKKTTFIFFFIFFCAVLLSLQSNTHRKKKRYLSSFDSFLLGFFFFFTNSRRFLSKYPLFSSLCLIKLCVNCVRFHRTSLHLSLSLYSDAV
jgi:hypothetical protein